MMAFGQPVRMVVCAVLILSLPAAAAAQTAGMLRGLITDERGTVLSGAVVTVSSVSQGVSGRAAVTDASGVFRVQGLPPARDYQVRVSLASYAAVALSGVEVPVGGVGSVRLALFPETVVRQRVEVRARPNVVDLEETTTQTRLTSEFVDTLPILGRDYQDALTLAPGVTDADGDGNPNIHGARDTDVVTLVDGVSTTDPLTGKVGAQLNIESIQEIEIKTSGATAEYGRAQGGFADIITKSGGNEFQGTFKFFWRGSALDGDGAGMDDPRLHAGIGESGLRTLRFNDYLPFLSLGGPIARDWAWFYVANESITREDPVNALNAAFLRGVRELREFLKLTWQVSPAHRLALSVNYDPQDYLNEGLNSFTREESGFTDHMGGTVVTLKSTGVLSPLAALETSVSSFDQRPMLRPNLGADTNGNGVFFVDRNGNGFMEASERDPGEDYDGDGKFDVFEDANHNYRLDPGEDLDGDGRLTNVCEGALREDQNCNGRLDPGEDRNHNKALDDTPQPSSLYPYGRLAPLAADRDYNIDRNTGIITGPYYEDRSDDRKRFTFRQDLSVFVPDLRGSHDLKMGLDLERESFRRHTQARDIISSYVRTCDPPSCVRPDSVLDSPFSAPPRPVNTVSALLPTAPEVQNQAAGFTAG
ncbi:MAG TPA: carboxypeptidase regulatory-like domain-containing protein, partial [Candidatus Dormibacteraeota bacterium]|nr:carboxypeptidase regulatory-like domain-containing protein [Candidatus Dormibacteraeota bacterium]